MNGFKRMARRSVVGSIAIIAMVTGAHPANAASPAGDPYAPYRAASVYCTGRGGGVFPTLQGANLYVLQERFDRTKWQYMQYKYAFWNGATGRYDIVSGWSAASWIAPGGTLISVNAPIHVGPSDNLWVSRFYTVQVWFRWTLLDTATNRTTVYQAPVINAANYNGSGVQGSYCDTDQSVPVIFGI